MPSNKFVINIDGVDYIIRESNERDKKTLKPYRYSLLNDTATCPTLAALSYGFRADIQANKESEPGAPRNMATDAGSACHRVFAAVRLWGLRADSGVFNVEGERLFGITDFQRMLDVAKKYESEGEAMQRRGFCLEALYTSGFYDDPYDKNRTLANLELTCIAYIDKWDYDRKVLLLKDRCEVGIEMRFDLVVEREDSKAFRFVGTLDGLHYAIDNNEKIVVHENKTGRYMNDAWARGFIMSHQVTGYCVAATVLTGQYVNEAVIFGSQIPIQTARPVRIEPVTREEQHFQNWLRWFLWAVRTYDEAVVDPIAAPKFTHSCGRFFGECNFIPFCSGDVETKEQMLDNMKKETTNEY